MEFRNLVDKRAVLAYSLPYTTRAMQPEAQAAFDLEVKDASSGRCSSLRVEPSTKVVELKQLKRGVCNVQKHLGNAKVFVRHNLDPVNQGPQPCWRACSE